MNRDHNLGVLNKFSETSIFRHLRGLSLKCKYLNPIQGQISRPSAGRQMQTQYRSPYCKEQHSGGPLSLKEKTLHSFDKSPSSQITHIAFPTCNLKKPPSLSLGTFPPQQHQGSPPLPGLGLGPHQHLLHFLEPEPLQKRQI